MFEKLMDSARRMKPDRDWDRLFEAVQHERRKIEARGIALSIIREEAKRDTGLSIEKLIQRAETAGRIILPFAPREGRATLYLVKLLRFWFATD